MEANIETELNSVANNKKPLKDILNIIENIEKKSEQLHK